MKITVVGASGRIGSQVVETLGAQGQDRGGSWRRAAW